MEILSAFETFKAQVRKARNFFSVDEVQLYYEFKETIGSGFFATVYKAVEIKSGEVVAIKCIDKTKVGEKVGMLQEEVNILSHVKHENCVQLFEIFESDKHVFLVMELVTGGELFDRIVQMKMFNEAIAARVVRQICLALSYIHKMGIVHRDLKPENILLDHADLMTAKVKITDFGLSKIMKGKGQFLHSRCGTPAYAAPELVEGRPYGPKVDMWAVGCLMYVMLCGSPPFRGRDNQELFVNICRGHYSLSARAWANVSKQAKDFIKRLLIVDPNGRLSAEDALKDPWIVGVTDRGEEVGVKGGYESLNPQEAMREFMSENEEAVKDYRDKSQLSFQAKLNQPSSSVAGPSAIASSSSSSSSPPSTLSSSTQTQDLEDDFSDLSEKSEKGRRSSHALLRMGSSSEASIKISANVAEEATGVLGEAVPEDTIGKMEERYATWPSFSREYMSGNLLGCSELSQIIKLISADSTWKRRSLEAGYLRPFLLLVSMHPRQRLGCAFSIGINLTSALWYGDAHREAWEIISNQTEGIRRKTGGHNAFKNPEAGPFWWDTVFQVANVTSSHFWSSDYDSKSALRSVTSPARDQLRSSSREKSDRQIADLEELFVRLTVKKIRKLKGDEEHAAKFKHVDDLAQAVGEEKKMIDFLREEIKNESVVLFFINWYLEKGYESKDVNQTFLSWVEKERQLTMSSVFLNKLPVRSLFPSVFTIVLQRVYLAAVGIFISEYWEEEEAKSLAAGHMSARMI